MKKGDLQVNADPLKRAYSSLKPNTLLRFGAPPIIYYAAQIVNGFIDPKANFSIDLSKDDRPEEPQNRQLRPNCKKDVNLFFRMFFLEGLFRVLISINDPSPTKTCIDINEG